MGLLVLSKLKVFFPKTESWAKSMLESQLDHKYKSYQKICCETVSPCNDGEATPMILPNNMAA